MNSKLLKTLTLALVAVAMIMGPSANIALAHCQVPCGIYGDDTRFATLAEHIVTIEKAMNQINELSKDPGANMNQLVRWVNTKEDHADQFSGIITAYFLQQRIKTTEAESDEKAYLNKITLCHKLLVSAMKAKQTTDVANAQSMSTLLTEFEEAYVGADAKKHVSEHHGHDHDSKEEGHRS